MPLDAAFLIRVVKVFLDIDPGCFVQATEFAKTCNAAGIKATITADSVRVELNGVKAHATICPSDTPDREIGKMGRVGVYDCLMAIRNVLIGGAPKSHVYPEHAVMAAGAEILARCKQILARTQGLDYREDERLVDVLIRRDGVTLCYDFYDANTPYQLYIGDELSEAKYETYEDAIAHMEELIEKTQSETTI